MKTFPMFLRMDGRTVVIVGGAEQAAQKARLILKTEASVIIVAPALDPELADLVSEGRAHQHTGLVGSELFAPGALVFVATGCVGADAAVADVARRAGALVNVVDQPALCDAFTPSIVDRDPVVVAIGTEGTAPVLGRQIKTRIETMLEPRLGSFAALAGRLRMSVAAQVPRAQRRAFWRWAFDDLPRRLHADGAERDAACVLKRAIAAGGAPDKDYAGSIALVGAGPGAADLLTLRAVRVLQEADVIFYDRLVGDDILELARRDAERVFVGKTVGANAWPQDRICQLIVAEALQGRRVVRLKGGDPLIFGRAEEELSAARAAGVAVTIVPGITAASAAAATLGRPLTERDVTDRVVLATATDRTGATPRDMTQLTRPGTSVALYMAMGQLDALRANFLAQGVDPELRIDIVSNATRPEERHLETTLASMALDVQAQGITGPAIIFITIPKTAAAAVRVQASYQVLSA